MRIENAENNLNISENSKKIEDHFYKDWLVCNSEINFMLQCIQHIFVDDTKRVTIVKRVSMPNVVEIKWEHPAIYRFF